MHLRRGLHPHRYQGVHEHRYHVHARRAPLLKMRATTELIGPARRIPSTRSAACRVLSDEGLLSGCFRLATDVAGWLTIKSACSGNLDVYDGGRTKTETAYAPEVTHQRAN